MALGRGREARAVVIPPPLRPTSHVQGRFAFRHNRPCALKYNLFLSSRPARAAYANLAGLLLWHFEGGQHGD